MVKTVDLRDIIDELELENLRVEYYPRTLVEVLKQRERDKTKLAEALEHMDKLLDMDSLDMF